MKRNYDKVTLLLHITLTVINYLFGLLLYGRLPDRIPLSFNLSGSAALLGPKEVLCFGIPTVFLLVFLVLEFAPKIDPRRKNYEQFSRRYKTLQHIILLFFSAVFWVHIHLALGGTLAVFTVVPVLFGAFLAICGNYVVTLRQNYIFGIRTPWALSSEWNWRKTHRFAGRLWVAAGIAIILCGLVYPPAAFVLIALAAISPVIYSLVLYLKYESNNAGGGESDPQPPTRKG